MTLNSVYTKIRTPSYSDVGALIGLASWVVGGNGTTVDNVHASGAVSGNLSTGGLIGSLSDESTLRNATSSVTVSGVSRTNPGDPEFDVESPSYIGGLVGSLNNSTIEDSRATGAVTATDDPTDELESIGGLVGSASGSTIRRSSATGAVNAGTTGYYVGGLVGYTNIVNIEDSTASGSVTGFENVGGLVGNADYDDQIIRSGASGPVNGVNEVGGLIGTLYGDAIVEDSFSTSTVTATGSRVGGLIGYSSGMNLITGSYATGQVTGINEVGGLVGSIDGEFEISQSHATGAVSGSGSQIGGLVGKAEGPGFEIRYSWSSSSVTGGGADSQGVGGLVGYALGGGTITRNYATGAVSNANKIGGLIGDVWRVTVDQNYATGNVTGQAGASDIGLFAGGLVGWAYADVAGETVLSNNFASGAVSFNGNIVTTPVPRPVFLGGLVGMVLGGIDISNSYAVGAVTTPTGVGVSGGLFGFLEPLGGIQSRLSNNFWDIDTTDQAHAYHIPGATPGTAAAITFEAGEVSGQTTAQMQNLFTYPVGDADVEGWDIAGDDTLTDGYPRLRWTTTGLTGGSIWVMRAPSITSVVFNLGVAGPVTYDGTTYELASFWNSPATIFTSCDVCEYWVLGTDYTFQQNGSTVTGFRNAGTYSNISVNILASGFGVASTGNTLGSLTINPRVIEITGTNLTREYNATTSFGVEGIQIANLVAGDIVSFTNNSFINLETTRTATINGVSRNITDAGSARAIANTGFTLTGDDAANYTVSGVVVPNGLTVNVTPYVIPLFHVVGSDEVAGFSASNRVYDGTTTVPLDGSFRRLNLGAGVGNNTAFFEVGVGAISLAYADRHAGVNKPFSGELTFVVTSGPAANYIVTNDPAFISSRSPDGLTVNFFGTGTVTPRDITLTNVQAQSRLYDGTTVATVVPINPASPTTLSWQGTWQTGFIAGDDVQWAFDANFADANAGDDKVVTLSNVGFTGADAGNYTAGSNFTFFFAHSSTSFNRANITPRPVAINVSRNFDGTPDFTTGFNLGNIIGGDTVTVTSGAASVSSRNAGTYNAFETNTLVLSNANYTLSGGTVLAVIDPRVLTITGTTVANKIFDGTTAATVTPGTVSGMLEGDSVRVVAATGLFNNANAGTRRSVRVIYTLDNDNYSLADEVLFANIEQSQTLLNQIAASRNVTQPSDGPGQMGSGQFGTLLPPTFSVAAGQGPVSGADGQQTPGNVIVATPSLTLPFTDPGELMMVGTPNPGDPANVVSLSEARQMSAGGQTEGEREVRVPVSRNSLAQIVNGGVRLPGGVDQKLFVVRK
jgi:trimeric autotransporter adhesin